MRMSELLSDELDKELSEDNRGDIELLVNDIAQKEKELLNFKTKASVYKRMDEARSYIMEKDFSGTKLLLHKKEDEVKIFFEEESDITSYFQDPEKFDVDIDKLEEFQNRIKKQALELSSKDYILDCTVVRGQKGINLFVCDVPYLGVNLANEPLYVRKDVLKKLSYTDNIKESPFVVVKNVLDLKESLELFSKFDDAEGVIAKKYVGTYCINGDTDNCICYKWGQVDPDEKGNIA